MIIKKNQKLPQKKKMLVIDINFEGNVVKIRIQSLPSLPPIILRINNDMERKDITKKINNFFKIIIL